MRALPLPLAFPAAVLAGLLVSWATPARAATPPPAEARAQKEQGDQRRKAGDAEGAAAAYQAALKLHGGYAEAFEGLGEVRYGQRRFPEAIQAFGDAVEIDPGYALAWYNLGFAARKGGEPQRARAAYERYVQLRPADPDGHFGLAEVLRGLGDREAALREYQLFVDLAAPIPAQAAWVEKARAHLAELKAPPAPERPAAPTVPAAVDAAGVMAASVAADAVAPTATPTPTAAPTATPTAAPTATPTPATPPIAPISLPPSSPAVIEKIGAGDRAALSGDHRAALFAYQDAIHLEPANPVALTRLGKAYLALRYPDKARAQAELALRLDPSSAEAKQLLADLERPPRLAGAPAQAPKPTAAPPQPHVYRFTPEGAGVADAVAGAAGPPAPPGGGAAPTVAPAPPPAAAAAPPPTQLTAELVAPAPPPATDRPSATQLYRSAVGLIGQREFERADAELSLAIELDPNLAVAYAARGSARFGLGKHRDAAEDYEAAIARDARLATPIWGLAECYRILGDPRAGETYARYAVSSSADAREDLRDLARKRARELGAQ